MHAFQIIRAIFISTCFISMLRSARKGLLWFLFCVSFDARIIINFFLTSSLSQRTFNAGLLDCLSREKYTFSLQSWTSAVLQYLKNPAARPLVEWDPRMGREKLCRVNVPCWVACEGRWLSQLSASTAPWQSCAAVHGTALISGSGTTQFSPRDWWQQDILMCYHFLNTLFKNKISFLGLIRYFALK